MSRLFKFSLLLFNIFIAHLYSVAQSNPEIVEDTTPAELNTVIIKGKKPLYEQKIDRLVVNVQGSITASGGSVLEVMQKSPGVLVNKQNNVISMNGKSGVRVMMNGKMIQLPPDAVIAMLDGMSTANVQKIELISAPPATDDAEGGGGIINIITKQNTGSGTNAIVGLTYGYRAGRAPGGNLNISHRKGRLACFIDYSINGNKNIHNMRLQRESTNNGVKTIIIDESRRPNNTNQQNVNGGVEWNTGRGTLLNVGLTGYRRNWQLDAGAAENTSINSVQQSPTDLQIHESNIWQSAAISLGMRKKINKTSQLNMTADYLYYNNDNPSQYRLSHDQENNSSAIRVEKKTPIKMLVGKIDYQQQLNPAVQMEAGIKGVKSVLDNDVLVKREIDQQVKTDSFFTTFSTLNEYVGAAYVYTKWNTGKDWHINSGLRYEYTHTAISSPTQKNAVNRKYGYLFPGIVVRKEMDRQTDVQLSYSRRITRPTYNDIAPYVFFWGPNTFSSGNTALKPAITDALRAAFHLKRWVISLDLSHTANEMAGYQPNVDSVAGNLTYRTENVKHVNTVLVANSYSHNITSWWRIQSNVSAQYQVMQTNHLVKNVKRSLYSYNVNIVNAITLSESFSLEISGIYQSKTLYGMAEFLGRGSLNAGIQKKIRDKATLRFAVDDILNTDYWRIVALSPANNVNTNFDYKFHNRFARLTFTVNLGNKKINSLNIKSGAEEERSRVN